MNNFSQFDTNILYFYLATVLVVGLLSAKKSDENTSEYFLAGKSMSWFIVGASLFMTNISSEHIIGLAGSGASNGLVVGHFEWMAVLALIVLGWIFAPIFIRTGIYTLPEFLEKRYNKTTRMYLAIVSIIAYIITKISVMIYAGSQILNLLLGWNIYTSAIVLVVITGIYTIAGGLRSVMYVGVVQIVFLLVGSFTLLIIGLQQVGGIAGLQAGLPASYFSMFRPMSDPDFPWTGILFGAPILGIWYWCTDQYIVQRLLSSKNINHAQKATIFAGFLKILPAFLFIIPGMIAMALYPDVSGDNAFAVLITNLPIPDGLRGLILTGVLAALMSSLAAVFNSTATILTIDFYKHYYPDSSDSKLVLIGRLSAIFIVIAGVFWVPLTKIINSHIYIYMQSVQAYISPPIAAVFIFGVLSKKVNSKGAVAALLFGGIIGALRLLLEIYNDFFPIEFFLLKGIIEINFLHFAVILFLVSSTILLTVSTRAMNTPKINDYLINFSSLISIKDGISINKNGWVRMNFLLSTLLIFVLIGLWKTFM